MGKKEAAATGDCSMASNKNQSGTKNAFCAFLAASGIKKVTLNGYQKN
jgi:hypothetical protein